MKTKKISILIVVMLLLIAIFTNPNQEDHKEKVKSTFTTYYQKSLKENQTQSENKFEALGSLLGVSLINTMIENSVTSDNYLIFSVTKMTYDGQEKSIGYGAFGNVFLSSKVEKAFKQ